MFVWKYEIEVKWISQKKVNLTITLLYGHPKKEIDETFGRKCESEGKTEHEESEIILQSTEQNFFLRAQKIMKLQVESDE